MKKKRKKEMVPLTKEQNKSYKEPKTCLIRNEKFCMNKDDENYKNRKKVKDHCASYDTHFIIKPISKRF